MSAEEFLGVWMALTITGAYLGLVALFCALCVKLWRWLDDQRRNDV